MILFNEVIKSPCKANDRKLLKSLLKLRRSQFTCNSQKIDIKFNLKSTSSWFEDQGMNFMEWQVVTVFMIEKGYWKKQDQDETTYSWYYKQGA